MTQSLQLICGNPNCKARLLIKDPSKSPEAKCPVCGYINPLPDMPVPTALPAAPLLPGDEHPTVLQKQVLPTEMGRLRVEAAQLSATPPVLSLRLGLNRVGRQSTLAPSELMIVTADETISRQHCTLEVRINRAGTVDYILQDGSQQPDGWKSSLNGTFLNGSKTRLGEYDRIYLTEGSVIQIGQVTLTLETLQLTEALRQQYRRAGPPDMQETMIKPQPIPELPGPKPLPLTPHRFT